MTVSIVALGDRDVRFATHRAVDAALGLLGDDVGADWVGTDVADPDLLAAADGVWILPGTPYRNEEAVMTALRRRRERGLATLGTCGGFQHMVVEFARNVLGMTAAGHAESDEDADHVIDRLACSLVGEVRVVTPVTGTRLAAIVGVQPFDGFHFCSFGVSPRHQGDLTAGGLHWSAFAPDAGVEALEVDGHPFYLGTLFQPQMSALDGELHPLLQAFVHAAREPRT